MTTINDIPSDCFQEIFDYVGQFQFIEVLYCVSSRFCREVVLNFKRSFATDTPWHITRREIQLIEDVMLKNSQDAISNDEQIQDKTYVRAWMKQLDDSVRYKNTVHLSLESIKARDDETFRHDDQSDITTSNAPIVMKKLQEFIDNHSYYNMQKNYDLSNFINLYRLEINCLNNATIYTNARVVQLIDVTNTKIIAPKLRTLGLVEGCDISIECPRLDHLSIIESECPPVVSARELSLYMVHHVDDILQIVNPEILIIDNDEEIEDPKFKQLIIDTLYHSIEVPDHLDLLKINGTANRDACLDDFKGKTVSKLIVPDLNLAYLMWQKLKHVDKIRISRLSNENTDESYNQFLDKCRI